MSLCCHTFSIAASCPESGRFGVAVATAIPAGGALCPFARPGVGALAIQAWVNPLLGTRGLELLEQGLSAEQALKSLLAGDPDGEKRQLALVDRHGGAAAFSGSLVDAWKGHLVGEGFALTGNFLTDEEVLQAMARAFEGSEGELSERLLAALEAGREAGGDRRNLRSAALYVVDREEFPYVDLRVDEHRDPLPELRRIFEIHKDSVLPHYDEIVRSLQTEVQP